MSKTIGEIAELAGVSKTTVSRVINNKPDVNPETRENILELIAKYNFQPNVFAKAISSQKSNNIGLIIPYTVDYIFSNQFYVDVLRGISTEIENSNYYLLICYVHEANYVDIFRQKRVDGFVLMSPASLHRDIIRELQCAEAPFVSTAKLLDEEAMVYVDVDNVRGASLAVEHLISLGHEKIAFVGKPALTSSQDRLTGYRQVLEKHGIAYQEDFVRVTASSSVKAGYEVMADLLQMDNPPTAVFLANDVMAMGAIKASQDLNLRVPEDISIVGFDDVPLAQYTTPALTTVRQPAFEKGVEATRLLLQFLENGIVPVSRTLDVELIVRNSTAACVQCN
jgi:DNA-binding LacI/PurR family transcriptional regulator